MREKYDDIIDRPHPASLTHAPMSQRDRAAQFSPFAALTGYDAVIRESARQTTRKRIPDEQRKNELDRYLVLLKEAEENAPEVCITFFVPDGNKDGGEYVTLISGIRRVDENAGKLLLCGGQSIDLNDIWDIQSNLFEALEETENE